MKVKDILISEIDEGERARGEYGDIEELAENIKDKGLQQPISVVERDGKYILAAGGRRLRACKVAGLEKVPAVVRDGKEVSHTDALEIELIENVFRKDFTWVERCQLEKKIYELKEKNDPNWSQHKTSALLGRARSAISQDLELAGAIEHLPELAEADSQNEAWKKWTRVKNDLAVQEIVRRQSEEGKKLAEGKKPEEIAPTARHRFKSFPDYIQSKYHIGDVNEGLRALQGPIIDFMEVDPPYAVNLAAHRKKAQDQHIVSTYNELDEKNYPTFLSTLATDLFRVMKENSWGIFWYGSKWYAEVCIALHKAGFKYNATPAIWTKTGGGYSPNPNTHLSNLYENFIVFRKGNPALLKPGRANLFHFSPPLPSARIHPTERPVNLIEEILETFTTDASIICVPFLGSGATLRAAFNRDQVAFGWDIDPVYKDRLLAKEITEEATHA